MKIQYVSDFLCLLTYYYMYRGGGNWGKLAYLAQPTTVTSFLENLYIYHYEILSLETNFSSKDMKYFCTAADRQKLLLQVL